MKISGYVNQSYQQPSAASSSKVSDKEKAATSTGGTPLQTPVDLGLLAQGTQSTAAIRIPSEGYASKLTDAEKKALDAIFARYRENPVLAERLETTGGEVGRILDVKV